MQLVYGEQGLFKFHVVVKKASSLPVLPHLIFFEGKVQNWEKKHILALQCSFYVMQLVTDKRLEYTYKMSSVYWIFSRKQSQVSCIYKVKIYSENFS